MPAYPLAEIRESFPLLRGGRPAEGGSRTEEPFVYLDSAATALTPQPVIEAVDHYYRDNSTNIHRGLYRLSEEATRIYEEGRARVARFIGASSPEEVIFTHGTTESINLLAYSWASGLSRDELVVATEMEHHANLLPWQQLSGRGGPPLGFIPVDSKSGKLSLGSSDNEEEELKKLIPPKTALVTLTGMSNVTGIEPPVAKVVRRAREVGAKVLLDAAQYSAHHRIDVQKLDVDFLVFSGHKLYGPTGIGVLWARSGLLDDCPPFLSGGDMIEKVSLEKSSFRPPPHRFEAGTPHIAGVAGLCAAMDFVESIGWESISQHEEELTEELLSVLCEMEGLELYGTRDTESRSSVVSFNLSNVHPHDAGTLLSDRGIAVRAGLHCAQPYVEKLGSGGTVRVALGMYTGSDDIHALKSGLDEVRSIFA